MGLWPEIVATDGSMGSCSLLSGFIPVHIFRVICIKFVLFSFQFLGTLTCANYRTLLRAKLREVTNSSPSEEQDPRNLATNSARSWLGEFPVLVKNMHM